MNTNILSLVDVNSELIKQHIKIRDKWRADKTEYESNVIKYKQELSEIEGKLGQSLETLKGKYIIIRHKNYNIDNGVTYAKITNIKSGTVWDREYSFELYGYEYYHNECRSSLTSGNVKLLKPYAMRINIYEDDEIELCSEDDFFKAIASSMKWYYDIFVKLCKGEEVDTIDPDSKNN